MEDFYEREQAKIDRLTLQSLRRTLCTISEVSKIHEIMVSNLMIRLGYYEEGDTSFDPKEDHENDNTPCSHNEAHT